MMLTLAFWMVLGADDWTQYRGSDRDAVLREKGLLETFPATGIKVRWRVEAAGGFSSPVIAQGRVYLCDAVYQPVKAKERIRCFDEKTGAVIWTYEYEVDYDDYWRQPQMKDGFRSTPTLRDGRLYAIGADADLMCLDAVKGAVIWKKKLKADYGLDVHWTCTPSPLIEGNLLIVVIGGKPEASVVAFEKDTGKEAWRALSDRFTYSSPIVLEAGGKRQLIVWTGQGVTSLDPQSGQIWWRERCELTDGPSIVSTPVTQGNLLLVSGMMFRLDAEKPSAKLIWPASQAPAKRVWSSTSSPLLQGDYVYAEKGGSLICVDVRTGEMVWKSDKVTAVRGGASIHLYPHGESVWMFTDQGNLIRASLTPEGYREHTRAFVIEPLYSFSGRKVVWTPPAFSNRHLFARNEKELICASLEATPD